MSEEATKPAKPKKAETLGKPADRTPPDEFQIMRRIGKLLDQLPAESRGRVTGWLLERLGEGKDKKRSEQVPGLF